MDASVFTSLDFSMFAVIRSLAHFEILAYEN